MTTQWHQGQGGAPYGPQYGYQNAPWPPPPRRGAPRWAIAVIATAMVLVLGLGVVIVLALLPGTASASEVTREPVATAGANPFMPAVGTDATGVTAPTGTGGTFRADTAGLYGGTRDDSACDGAKLVRFLESHPGEAAAWAGVLGIRTAEIADYVSGLTPVVLRADTLVTNHGYASGRATVMSSVLQAGSAVFVDVYGSPVVRCACGNPLTAPTLLTSPIYVGPTWVSFNQTNVTVVQTSTTIINDYTLVDPWERRPFTRPSRSDGTRDGDSTYSPETFTGGGFDGRPSTGGDPGTSSGPSTSRDSGSSSDPSTTSGDPAVPFDPSTARFVCDTSGPALAPDGASGGTPATVAATSAADLTSDGKDDTAVLLECASGTGSGSGEPIQDVQVFGSDGTQLGSLGSPQAPAGSTVTPRFDPSTFTLSPGSLQTGMDVFAPADTTTPTLSQTWTWDWNGSSFTLDQSTVTPVEASEAPVPSTLPGTIEPIAPVAPSSSSAPSSSLEVPTSSSGAPVG
ncbi:hypothetical protein EV383_2873 [Pseudonocardia sediminis]|uniref:DUF6777 domain-containing protein n=1 Tax=Pseudonocardia sediminis TaxID=1397368 RepID=A0A4Q7UW27_PSEST|nr:DUF6777 domain-containing protein [Pseudonocardia sediminis]RZT85985.1 hypothetical protein EV383_2873 [Pseudonocardia sediminis]